MEKVAAFSQSIIRPYHPVQVKKLHPDAIIPEYKKQGDAGFDFYLSEDLDIPPNTTKLAHTGLAFAIPEGYELQIRLRSGVGLKNTIIVVNAPGTVDSGYRGEVGIILRNIGDKTVFLKRGERVAQGIVSPVVQASFIPVEELPESDRGDGGFGSTGKN